MYTNIELDSTPIASFDEMQKAWMLDSILLLLFYTKTRSAK